MTSASCPRCNAPHDGLVDKLGWATCRQCVYCWQMNPMGKAPVVVKSPPSAPKPAAQAISSTPPAAAVPVPKRPIGGSGEYAPDEGFGTQPQTEPLAARGRSSSASGRGPAIKPVVTPGLKHPPKPESEPEAIDSELFDRMEHQAQARRSNMPTMVEGEVPAVAAAAAAAASSMTKAPCPVCGNRFVLVGNPPAAYQTCPQCSTTFNHVNGRLAIVENDPSQNSDLLIGRTIRGCTIDKKIGEGGMGAVYHAKQLSLDRSVAIKVMPAELARNKNFIQRFEREAKSLARINHPNILHIYDFGEDSAIGIYFMIIEFVDGKDLGEVLRERQVISQQETLDLVRQALLGLETAGEKDVIHRDIKPDNLMISKEGICKVSDFGLAKGYGSLDEVTSAGVRVGTPAFMSPEQCDGGDVDCRSDVYSLGCTAFLALTGYLPFSGDSPFSIMLKHKTEPAPSLRTFRPDLEPDVDALVLRMLAKRPDERCTVLRDLIDEVERLQVALAGGQPLPRKSTGERPRSLNDSGAVMLLPDGPVSQGHAGSHDTFPSAVIPDMPVRPSSPSPAPQRSEQPRSPIRPMAPARTPAPAFVAPPESPISLQLVPEPSLPSRGTPPPQSTQSSASILVAKGDEAASSGKPSEAIRAYQEAMRKKGVNRDIQGKIADAKRQQRTLDLDQVEQRGDELAAAGRLDDAVDEWLRASQMSSQVARRETLLGKIDRIQRRSRRRTALRRLTGALLLLGLAAVNLYLWPPMMHQREAQARLERILAIEQPKQRAVELERFVAEVRPHPWFSTIFRHEYRLPAVDVASKELDKIAAEPTVDDSAQRQAERDGAEVARIEQLAGDTKVPWQQVLEQAARVASTMGDAQRRTQLEAVAAQAKEQIQQMSASATVITQTQARGEHAAALSLVAEFQRRYPRSGGVGAALPLAGHLVVEVEGHDGLIDGLRVLADGVQLVGDATTFCRSRGKPTVVEAMAPGFLSESRTLPADAVDAAKPVVITLKPAVVWTHQLPFAAPWWSLTRFDQDTFLVTGPRLVQGFTLRKEALQSCPRSAVPVPPATPDPVWTLVEDRGQNRLIAASSDGIVAALAWEPGKGPVFQDLLRKGSVAILGWLERELVLQPGKRVQVILEYRDGVCDAVCVSGADELWRVKGTKISQLPYLDAQQDRLVVVDDGEVRVLEEDGGTVGSHAFSAKRRGPVLPLASGRVLAVNTVEGIDLLRLGGQPDFLMPMTPDLSRIGPAATAASGEELLVARLDGSVVLLRVEGESVNQVWSARLPTGRKPGAIVGISGSYALVTDDANAIHLFGRADGALIRRYDVPRALATAPLVMPQRLVVIDQSGELSVHFLPE